MGFHIWMMTRFILIILIQIFYFFTQSQSHLPSWFCYILSYKSKKPQIFFFLIHWQLICLCKRDVVKIFFSLMRRILMEIMHQCLWDKIKNLHVHAFCSATCFCYLNVKLTFCKTSIILDDSPHSIVMTSSDHLDSYY